MRDAFGDRDVYEVLGVSAADLEAAYKELQALIRANLQPNSPMTVAMLIFGAQTAALNGIPLDLAASLVGRVYVAPQLPSAPLPRLNTKGGSA